MTLIGAVSCPDGFVLGADTEVTRGEVLVTQSEKLDRVILTSQCRYFIGGAGDEIYLGQFKADLLKATREVKTADEFEEHLRSELRALHEDTIFPLWNVDHPNRPQVEFIVGFVDTKRVCSLWKTSDIAVCPITTFDFIGTGAIVAYHVAQKLMENRPSVTIAHHLLTQITIEGRLRGAGVGGDVETWSVRNFMESPAVSRRFFLAGTEVNKGYLWDLEEAMCKAIRAGLEGDRHALETHKKVIADGLDGLWARSQSSLSDDREEYHVFYLAKTEPPERHSVMFGKYFR